MLTILYTRCFIYRPCRKSIGSVCIVYICAIVTGISVYCLMPREASIVVVFVMCSLLGIGSDNNGPCFRPTSFGAESAEYAAFLWGDKE